MNRGQKIEQRARRALEAKAEGCPSCCFVLLLLLFIIIYSLLFLLFLLFIIYYLLFIIIRSCYQAAGVVSHGLGATPGGAVVPL